MKTFIIRIWSPPGSDSWSPESIRGTIEDVGGSTPTAFVGPHALLSLLGGNVTPDPRETEDKPAEEGFVQIEFPPTFADFVEARRRFLDQISVSPHNDTPTPLAARGRGLRPFADRATSSVPGAVRGFACGL